MLWRKQQFTSGCRFSEGRESVTKEERSGRSATSRTEEKIAKICQIVRENRRLTVRSIAEQVNIDRETVRKTLTEDLDMRKVCAKMVRRKSKGESQFAKTFWRGKMTFWAVSSQVMKHGSTNTTLKRSGKVYNGRLPIPPRPKVPSVQIKSQNKVASWLDSCDQTDWAAAGTFRSAEPSTLAAVCSISTVNVMTWHTVLSAPRRTRPN